MNYSASFLLCALVAWSVTRVYLRWAARMGVLDVPGARSSHPQPTPTGGGVGILAGVAAGCVATGYGAGLGADWLCVLAAVPVLAVLGFRDDRGGMPVAPRLAAQLAAATVVAFVAGARPGDPAALALGVSTVFGVTWATNAFNFMDGIDGIAGAQALFLAGAAAVLLASNGAAPDSLAVCVAMAGGAAGFLWLNWPPAHVFMGDTGSQPLGFLLAAAAGVTAARGELSLPVWLILWAGFLADASVTLLVRAADGNSPLAAHRDHAYQRLARRWGGHRPVTLLWSAVNMVWLFPLAWLANRHDGHATAIALMAWLPLIMALVWIRRRTAAD